MSVVAEDTPKKLGKAKKADRADPARFDPPGLSFKGKLIGVEDVPEPRGDKMCQVAMAKLKAAVRTIGDHKQRIVVNVSIRGIQILDERAETLIHDHRVNRISFISRDIGDTRAFGYVYGRGDGLHHFYGIKTEKAAETVVLCLHDLFQIVFEMKKKEQALKQQQGATAVTVRRPQTEVMQRDPARFQATDNGLEHEGSTPPASLPSRSPGGGSAGGSFPPGDAWGGSGASSSSQTPSPQPAEASYGTLPTRGRAGGGSGGVGRVGGGGAFNRSLFLASDLGPERAAQLSSAVVDSPLYNRMLSCPEQSAVGPPPSAFSRGIGPLPIAPFRIDQPHRKSTASLVISLPPPAGGGPGRINPLSSNSLSRRASRRSNQSEGSGGSAGGSAGGWAVFDGPLAPPRGGAVKPCEAAESASQVTLTQQSSDQLFGDDRFWAATEGSSVDQDWSEAKGRGGLKDRSFAAGIDEQHRDQFAFAVDRNRREVSDCYASGGEIGAMGATGKKPNEEMAMAHERLCGMPSDPWGESAPEEATRVREVRGAEGSSATSPDDQSLPSPDLPPPPLPIHMAAADLSLEAPVPPPRPRGSGRNAASVLQQRRTMTFDATMSAESDSRLSSESGNTATEELKRQPMGVSCNWPASDEPLYSNLPLAGLDAKVSVSVVNGRSVVLGGVWDLAGAVDSSLTTGGLVSQTGLFDSKNSESGAVALVEPIYSNLPFQDKLLSVAHSSHNQNVDESSALTSSSAWSSFSMAAPSKLAATFPDDTPPPPPPRPLAALKRESRNRAPLAASNSLTAEGAGARAPVWGEGLWLEESPPTAPPRVPQRNPSALAHRLDPFAQGVQGTSLAWSSPAKSRLEGTTTAPASQNSSKHLADLSGVMGGTVSLPGMSDWTTRTSGTTTSLSALGIESVTSRLSEAGGCSMSGATLVSGGTGGTMSAVMSSDGSVVRTSIVPVPRPRPRQRSGGTDSVSSKPESPSWTTPEGAHITPGGPVGPQTVRAPSLPEGNDSAVPPRSGSATEPRKSDSRSSDRASRRSGGGHRGSNRSDTVVDPFCDVDPFSVASSDPFGEMPDPLSADLGPASDPFAADLLTADMSASRLFLTRAVTLDVADVFDDVVDVMWESKTGSRAVEDCGGGSGTKGFACFEQADWGGSLAAGQLTGTTAVLATVDMNGSNNAVGSAHDSMSSFDVFGSSNLAWPSEAPVTKSLDPFHHSACASSGIASFESGANDTFGMSRAFDLSGVAMTRNVTGTLSMPLSARQAPLSGGKDLARAPSMPLSARQAPAAGGKVLPGARASVSAAALDKTRSAAETFNALQRNADQMLHQLDKHRSAQSVQQQAAASQSTDSCLTRSQATDNEAAASQAVRDSVCVVSAVVEGSSVDGPCQTDQTAIVLGSGAGGAPPEMDAGRQEVTEGGLGPPPRQSSLEATLDKFAERFPASPDSDVQWAAFDRASQDCCQSHSVEAGHLQRVGGEVGADSSVEGRSGEGKVLLPDEEKSAKVGFFFGCINQSEG